MEQCPSQVLYFTELSLKKKKKKDSNYLESKAEFLDIEFLHMANALS